MVKKSPLTTAIFCFVLTAHLIFIACSRFSIRATPRPRQPLVIRTHPLTPPPASTQKLRKKKKRKTPHVNPKKKSPHPSIKKKKKRPAPSSRREVRQALAKIHSLPPKIEAQVTLDVPHAVTALHIDQPTREEEKNLTPEEALTAYLRRFLTLPAYGTVTLEMTITSGKLTHMTVLDAENAVNATYLQHHLPLLSFPETEEGSQTWTLTFCNET